MAYRERVAQPHAYSSLAGARSACTRPGRRLAALVLVIRRSITQMDELARHIHYQALAVVAAMMVTAIAGWAFLERAGLPHIEWSIYAAPAFTLAWAVLVTLIARRYE